MHGGLRGVVFVLAGDNRQHFDYARKIAAQAEAHGVAPLIRQVGHCSDMAGAYMAADFVAVPPYWSVGQVIDHMRESPDLPESFSDIFVVDATHRVVGSLDLSRLLRTKRHVAISTITDTDRHVMLATEDQEKVAREFERYDLRSAPVVDANDRLIYNEKTGVLTYDFNGSASGGRIVLADFAGNPHLTADDFYIV